MKIKNLKINKEVAAIVLAGTIALVGLTGCSPKELAPKEEYDIINQTQENSDGLLKAGLIQTLDVPGESFKLITEYSCDSATKRSWRVTSDKFLYLKVYTKDLPADTKVYIDNIHIDTSIKSKYATMDGIIQDTMDDRIHNTEMIGFPVGNDICYYGVDAIEGSNQDFIQGTFSGINGYETGEIEQKRYTESDYIKYGVYASKFQIVYDLLIQTPKDSTPRNVSINTDFLVPVSQEPIEYEDANDKEKTYKK